VAVAQNGASPIRTDAAGFDQPIARDELVFNSDGPGNYELFAMRTDGSGLRQLTQDPAYHSWWGRISPSRDQLLFYRTPTSAKGHYDSEPGETGLWMLRADGSQPREIRPKGADGWQVQGHAEWSPDGSQLVMLGGKRINPQIFITDTSGAIVRSVTHDRPGSNVDPSWSPDGRSIAFVGCPQAICFEKDLEIYTIAIDGTNEKRLTNNSLRDQDPYYSPDAKQIAWIEETEPNAFGFGIGVWNIFLMAPDGSNQRSLTNDREINSKPAWSVDGGRIYFHRLQPDKSNRWSIFAINPDGTGLTEVTRGWAANAEYPAN
jgi:Tol biopolymer transport system component